MIGRHGTGRRSRVRPLSRSSTLLAGLVAMAGLTAVAGQTDASRYRPHELKRLSLEELMSLEVTTLSRRGEPVEAAAAAVYVLTGEDIRRAGVSSLPEALRLIPAIEVARLGTHSWAISLRGFNSTTANKLLVMIDGRSVYTPLYSGVFWDAQDVLLADIERIEVIAGPGGALWGANAVNGIVNVISKRAGETLGGLAELGMGTEERVSGAVRYGWTLGERGAIRLYTKGFERDASALADGSDAWDDWRMGQAGFRLDRESRSGHELTVQGDFYLGEQTARYIEFELATPPPRVIRNEREDVSRLSGGNLLGRWQRELAGGARLQLQAYWDRTHRYSAGVFEEDRDTFDLDLQHTSRLGRRHDVVWGLGYRVTSDEIEKTPFVAFEPASRTDHLASAFIHDEISLTDRLSLSVGTKLEHNDYTGFELQPSLRGRFRPDPEQTWWAAASRAVRTPTRFDDDLVLTTPIDVPTVPLPVLAVIRGSADFESEEVIAYELGWRGRLCEGLVLDLATFYNEYDRLQSFEPLTPVLVLDAPVPFIELPNVFANGLEGEAWGGTAVAGWVAARWRAQLSYTHLDLDLTTAPGSLDAASTANAGTSPSNQVGARVEADLPRHLELAVALRYVDRLPAQDVDSYVDGELTLGWRPREGVELSLTARNLFNAQHREFGGNAFEIERSIRARLRWSF